MRESVQKRGDFIWVHDREEDFVCIHEGEHVATVHHNGWDWWRIKSHHKKISRVVEAEPFMEVEPAMSRVEKMLSA